MVSRNVVWICPITFPDITNSDTMFGPNLTGTRDKTVQQNSYSVMMDYIALYKFLIITQVRNSCGRCDLCEQRVIIK